MISDIMPPWVFPTSETVKVLEKKQRRFIEGYYCFVEQKWKDTAGKTISIVGWKHK